MRTEGQRVLLKCLINTYLHAILVPPSDTYDTIPSVTWSKYLRREQFASPGAQPLRHPGGAVVLMIANSCGRPVIGLKAISADIY